MLKKIFGISAVALLAAGTVACAGGNTGGSGETQESTAVAEANTQAGEELESMEVTGTPLALPDITGDMKAKGAKIDLSAEVEKYKSMVTLAEYKGVAVTKGDAYEITQEEIDQEIDMMLEHFREYDDVTEGGAVQTDDRLVLSTDASVDGQAYEPLTAENENYTVGSELIAEEFDKQLEGHKANEDFEINVTFPEDYMDDEMLEEGEVSLNGKTVLFKTKITKIERPKEETADDEWVRKHKQELAEYSYGEANTLEELKAVIKKNADEGRAQSLLKERGGEALSSVIASSQFSSYPEDELNVLKEQTKANLNQEYENYKEMMGVNSLEEYVKLMTGGEEGESVTVDDYADEQAKQYLQNKMAAILIADAEGIEIGEDDVKELGESAADYYGFDSFEAMQKEYGESVKENFTFEALYEKVSKFLGSLANPSLEAEPGFEDMMELETEPAEETEAQN